MHDYNRNLNSSYIGPRKDILNNLPLSCKRILDLGCSTGTLGGKIKERQNVFIVGADINPTAAAQASQVLDKVYIGDLDKDSFLESFRGGNFDAVICGDVLEHLRDPWKTLSFLVSECTTRDAFFIISLPNVGHWSTLYKVFIRGYWPLNDRGIHDRTHLRWFTVNDTKRLIKESGLKIDALQKKTRLTEDISYLNGGIIEKVFSIFLGNLLVHQILLKCRKPYSF